MSALGSVEAERVELGRLVQAEWNANRVPAKVLAKVRRSIEEFGLVENLVARPHPTRSGDLEVLSGNHRLEVIRDLGFETAPVVVVDLGEADARLLAQTLNRTRGEDDDPAAYAALLEVVLAEVGVGRAVELLPETESSIDRVLRAFGPAPPADPDEVGAVPVEPQSQAGEVYELGRHRLLCGDATNLETLGGLVGSSEVEVLWTDPPYGVDYVGKTPDALTMRNDTATGLAALLHDSFAAADSVMAPGARFYCAAPPGPRELDFRLAIDGIGWKLHQTLIWSKDVFVLGHADYHYCHEPILYGYKPGAGRVGRGDHAGTRWYGGHDQSSLFEIPRPKRSTDHPTMKPVDLIVAQLLNSSRPGDAVLDMFAGSGSTLIACENLGRRCFAVEVEPSYCDVIRQRYADFTDQPEYAP